jgi:abortive infection bacteriophage resistance protein
MGKKATDVNAQIQLLKNRGMILDYDEAKIKEFLLDIGYYRLGFYWNPFEIDGAHNLQEGITFRNVIKLYYLDVDLRNILAKYINRIEINFKTKLTYYVSNKNENSPTWFVNNAVVNSNFIENFGRYYNGNFIKSNKAIKKHHQKYINDKYAPAWKKIEFLTFGTVLTLYKNLKDDDLKLQIANQFGIESLKKFTNLMETVLLVRSYCAHGDILFDLKTPKGIAVIPAIQFNGSDRNSLDACIKVVSYFLGVVSINRQDEMDKILTNKFLEHIDNNELKKIITESIKYQY